MGRRRALTQASVALGWSGRGFLGFVRSGAWALMIGSVMTCLVFAFHPSHIDPHPIIGAFTLSQIVHSGAIIAAPVLLYGIWSLAEWLDWSAPARLGLVFGAIGLVLSVNAAIISSFVTPAAATASGLVLSSMAANPHMQSHGASAMHGMASMPPLVQLSVAMNRGLAQAHVALWSLSLLLFAFALLRRSSALWAVGSLVAAFPLAWQLSGRFSPETHTMPIIAFTQSAWLIAVALAMLRSDRVASAYSNGSATIPVQTA
jgi:hypothetical protein